MPIKFSLSSTEPLSIAADLLVTPDELYSVAPVVLP